MVAIPYKFLIHEIEYHEFDGTDRWQNDSYKTPATIKRVRCDVDEVSTVTGEERKNTEPGVIFVDCTFSSNVPDTFKLRSKIAFNDNDYFINKVIPLYHPITNKVRHWELEVI